MRLLLLEDDLTLGEGLRDYLRSEGNVVDWCTILDEARPLLGQPYDAWLVDWNMPDGSGVEWIRARRAKGSTVPALLLTARDQVCDRIAGLDSGADDYLVKPFAPEELSARLRAIARRLAGSATRRTFGTVEIDLNRKQALLEGRRIELTAREWSVLEALTLRAGHIVSRSDLEALVLDGDSEVASNSIDVYIYKLRNKLGRNVIQTVRGLGYRISER